MKTKHVPVKVVSEKLFYEKYMFSLFNKKWKQIFLSIVFVEKSINRFLESNGGWLILTLHGLDNEGWGPLSSNYLDKLLNRLIKVNYLKIKTIGDVLV